MIIFDLDGTLADCEHRRHFIANPNKRCSSQFRDCICEKCNRYLNWKSDWKAFHEVCDKDEPILSVIGMLNIFRKNRKDVEIWSGRCESLREKTERWIEFNCFPFSIKNSKLKMRPIGDTTPDQELKERWLDEYMFGEKCIYPTLENAIPVNKVDFVFDSNPEVIRMWRKRGIFVFNCSQNDGDFQ